MKRSFSDISSSLGEDEERLFKSNIAPNKFNTFSIKDEEKIEEEEKEEEVKTPILEEENEQKENEEEEKYKSALFKLNSGQLVDTCRYNGNGRLTNYLWNAKTGCRQQSQEDEDGQEENQVKFTTSNGIGCCKMGSKMSEKELDIFFDSETTFLKDLNELVEDYALVAEHLYSFSFLAIDLEVYEYLSKKIKKLKSKLSVTLELLKDFEEFQIFATEVKNQPVFTKHIRQMIRETNMLIEIDVENLKKLLKSDQLRQLLSSSLSSSSGQGGSLKNILLTKYSLLKEIFNSSNILNTISDFLSIASNL
jgi:hypothetical protein